jgi:hypothetical protein
LWPQTDIRIDKITPWHMYLVSYVPPLSPEGSCHQIKIKVDRDNASALARDEYCNTKHPAADPLNGMQLGKQMEDYANSAQNGKLALAVQVGSFFSSSGQNRVDIAVEFPWNALKRQWHGFNLDAMVAVSGLIYDKNKVLAARFSDRACFCSDFWIPSVFSKLPLSDPSSTQSALEYVLIPSRYETQVDLPPGDYDLKLVVTDGEKSGRVEVPLNVDGYHQDSLAVSGIILSKRFHTVLDGPPKELRAPQYVPLVSDGLEFTPAGDTHFKKKERLLCYFEIYEPLLGGTEAVNVQLRMKVTDAKTGELKSDTGLRPVESGMRPGNPVIPVAREIAIKELHSGTYRLEVQASDSAGRSTAWRAATFTVE